MIVTISSISAYAASVNRGDYCMSKAALAMLTPLFAARLAANGINVYEIRPGVIATDMIAGAFDAETVKKLVPMQRAGRPEEVADLIGFLASDQAAYISGQVISINGALV
jgi:3-oxoacyl-[acyl-carrier protein] reductase